MGNPPSATAIEDNLYDPTNAALRARTASAIFDGFGMASMEHGVDLLGRLDPVCVDMRRVPREGGRGARRVVARKIVGAAAEPEFWIIRAVSMIFNAERRIVLCILDGLGYELAAGKSLLLSSSGSGLDEHIRPRLLGICDDLERGNLENILTLLGSSSATLVRKRCPGNRQRARVLV